MISTYNNKNELGWEYNMRKIYLNLSLSLYIICSKNMIVNDMILLTLNFHRCMHRQKPENMTGQIPPAILLQNMNSFSYNFITSLRYT